MRSRLTAALALAATAPLAVEAAALQYHTRVQSTVNMDRFRGLVGDHERLDVHQRLRLNVFEGAPAAVGLRIDAQLDLEIGADFGPEPDERATIAQSRLAELDLRDTRITLRWSRLSLSLGRQLFFDAVGASALDGATVLVRPAPYTQATARVGLATRRTLSGFGPDRYTPDGLRASERVGYVAGVGLATRGLRWLKLAADWRREFDTGAIQAEAVGATATAELHPLATLRGVAVWDLMAQRLAVGRIGGVVGPRWLRLDLEAARLRPRFSFDSIWNVFGDTGHDRLATSAVAQLGEWQLGAGGSWLYFPVQTATDQRPAEAFTPLKVSIASDTAYSVYGRISRPLSGGPGRAGAEVRRGDGYGGRRQLVDVFAETPTRWDSRSEPLLLGVRLGALTFDDTARRARTGLSGWGALSVNWRLTEIGRLAVVGEGYAGRETPWRTRLMGTFTMEDWW